MLENIKYFFWFLSGGEIRKLNKELLVRYFIVYLMNRGWYLKKDNFYLDLNECDEFLEDFLETYDGKRK